MTDPIVVDPNLKVLIEANSAALAVLLAKIASGDQDVTDELSQLSTTDAAVKAAITEIPNAPESPVEPAAAD